MTKHTLPAALAAALVLAPALAVAQVPPLPLQTPSERMIDQTNRNLSLQREITRMEQQREFERGQLEQRIDRLEMFPRVTVPPPGVGVR